MAETSKNGTAKKVKTPPPTEGEANMMAAQVNHLVSVDQRLNAIIDGDVEMGVYDSPFSHPLYAVRVKLDSIRGRKGRRVAAYARSVKSKKVKA